MAMREAAARRRPPRIDGTDDVQNKEAQQRHQHRLDQLEQREEELASARWRSETFLGVANNLGYGEAVRAHKHYLEGSGKPLVVDAEVARDYGPVNDAEQGILGLMSEWFMGIRTDSVFGDPWLDLEDGERIVLGDLGVGAGHFDGLVRCLPIRLTPMTATCRVPPLSRVKLGIGWSRGVARDAEQ